jgi:hypothetical protein
MPARKGSVKLVTTTAVLTVKDIGDVILLSSADVVVTIPDFYAAYEGLWYRFLNLGAGIVTIKSVDLTQICIVYPKKEKYVACSGTAWYALVDDFIGSDATPLAPEVNDVWVDTDTESLRYWTGTEWKALTAQSPIEVSDATPLDPALNLIWLNTNTDTQSYWNGVDWVPVVDVDASEETLVVSATEPVAPTTNLVWVNSTDQTMSYWNGAAWVPIVDMDTPEITVGAVAPGSPALNDLWLDTGLAQWYFWNGSAWTETVGGGGGPGGGGHYTVYDMTAIQAMDATPYDTGLARDYTPIFIMVATDTPLVTPYQADDTVYDKTGSPLYGTQTRVFVAITESIYDKTSGLLYGTQTRAFVAITESIYDKTAAALIGTLDRALPVAITASNYDKTATNTYGTKART